MMMMGSHLDEDESLKQSKLRAARILHSRSIMPVRLMAQSRTQKPEPSGRAACQNQCTEAL